jgi:hypothetical protein
MNATEIEAGGTSGKKRRRTLFGWVSLALLAAAVVTELRKPKQDRTWQGQLGFIPYDLRFPTPERVKASLWSPDDSRWFLPRAAGVGWSPNLGRVYRLVSRP